MEPDQNRALRTGEGSNLLTTEVVDVVTKSVVGNQTFIMTSKVRQFPQEFFSHTPPPVVSNPENNR